MPNLTSDRLIYIKGLLFALGGVLASILLLMERPTLKVALLLAIAIWCFARAYYFAFYVIEKYVDSEFKFAGIGSFVRHQWRKCRRRYENDP